MQATIGRSVISSWLLVLIWSSFLMIGFIPILGTGVGFLFLNTEFLFDSVELHGNEIGASINIPSSANYQAKAKSIANLFERYQADLAALTEVKNRECLELVRNNLNRKESRRVIFQKDRDTYTDQHVAMPSKFLIVDNVVTGFLDQWPNYTYTYQGKNKFVQLSKMLGCELNIHGKNICLIVDYLT